MTATSKNFLILSQVNFSARLWVEGTISTIKSDQAIQLPDGRTLGYSEFGEPEGVPVFYFHGLPGSRLEAQLIDQFDSEINTKLISIDRPGRGISDFLKLLDSDKVEYRLGAYERKLNKKVLKEMRSFRDEVLK